MPRKKKPKFENCIEDINREIAKRRNKWNLTALCWMDFEDVSQILRIHIHKKWHMYDPEKPLGPWVNRIISNQIKNLIRNNYGNFARPCLKCAAAEGVDLCSIYGKQDTSCPLYKHWFIEKLILPYVVIFHIIALLKYFEIGIATDFFLFFLIGIMSVHYYLMNKLLIEKIYSRTKMRLQTILYP